MESSPAPTEELISIKLINRCEMPNSNITTHVRRFAVPAAELNVESMLKRSYAAFGIPFAHFHMCYYDDEDDCIKIGTDEELREGLRLSKVKNDLYRLYLTPNKPPPTASRQSAAELNLITHAPEPAAAVVAAAQTHHAHVRTPRVNSFVFGPMFLSFTVFVFVSLSLTMVGRSILSGEVSQSIPTTTTEPEHPLCTHYLHTIYTDPYFDSHKGETIIFRDWSNQLRSAKVMYCGTDYYFYLDGKHSTSLNYKRWNGEAWTATIRPGKSEIKFHHVKADSGGRTSFNGRAFEVTNSAGQRWVSAVTASHQVELTTVRLQPIAHGPQRPYYPS